MAKKFINPSLKKNAFAAKDISIEDLANRLTSCDHVALSRAITIIESKEKSHRKQANHILNLVCDTAESNNSLRIAISGSPGSGKSSLIEALIKDKVDSKFAILTIDPSSSQSHGSILGDKTRMEELVKMDNIFIRPTAAGDTLGGVADRTRETILLCEAAGFDYIIVETVGVGQSETAVSDMVDLFILLILAGAGDEVQGIKRGIMELADLILVTKADGDRIQIANESVRSYRNAMHLFRSKYQNWTIPVIPCSSLNGNNLDKVWAKIIDFKAFANQDNWLVVHRNMQNQSWYNSHLKETILLRILSDDSILRKIQSHKDRIKSGDKDIWNMLAEL